MKETSVKGKRTLYWARDILPFDNVGASAMAYKTSASTGKEPLISSAENMFCWCVNLNADISIVI